MLRRAALSRPTFRAALCEAALERVHEVHDLCALLAFGLRGPFLEREASPGREQLLERLAIAVGMLGGVELAGHLLDERASHLHLRRSHRGLARRAAIGTA